jgi:hypothetical protein
MVMSEGAMNRRVFLAGTTLGLLDCGARTAVAQKPASAGAGVRVRAVSAKSREWLKGARVFVIGDDGCQLAEAYTDELGIATIPQLPAGSKPRYIVVDCEWYFVTGRRWEPGLLEYQMLLLGLTPPGFSG